MGTSNLICNLKPNLDALDAALHTLYSVQG